MALALREIRNFCRAHLDWEAIIQVISIAPVAVAAGMEVVQVPVEEEVPVILVV